MHYYKGVETSLKQTRFKNLEGKFERESLKKIIPANGGLESLQIHRVMCQRGI